VIFEVLTAETINNVFRNQTNSSLVYSERREDSSWTGPEGSRRLRLPDFKTVGT
jgi:hypothetical protein